MLGMASLFWIVVAQVPTTTLAGTVVGPGGEPLVGAELILVGMPSYVAPIVARGKSGEGGRFSLDRPTALAGDHHPQRAPILWVVKRGFQVSATRFPEALPRADEPVRVVLEPPGRAEVRVEGPDGRPVAGVQVLPERLKTPYTNLPDEVAEMVAATTDAGGLAVIEAVAAEELTYADVHSREFGIQGRLIAPRPGKPAVIALRPVGTWKGRLSAGDPAHVRGWHVRAWTRVGGGARNEPPQTTGYVVTTTDDEGRFALAPIAVGPLQLELKPPGDLPVMAALPRGLVVRAGREDSVDIPLKRTANVTGLVLERGTGKPVPGVSVHLTSLGPGPSLNQNDKTDETGRFTLRSLPGPVRVSPTQFPPSHVRAPGQDWEDFTVADPPRDIELAPREALPAAPPLRGRVVDEAGRAVAGAAVQASWRLAGGRGSSSGNIQVTADDRGRFVLEGLGPGSSVTIQARFKDRQSEQPVKARAGDTEPLTVAIAPMPVLALGGRVLGPGGAPVAAVPVKVEFRVEQNNFPGFARPVRFDGNPEVATGPDGTYRTPKELERKPSEFRVAVAAEGYYPARTPWVPAPDGDLLTLPDLTLRPLRGVRDVAGRVVDRDGTAVPGATLSSPGVGPQRASARSDAEGRFRLARVARGEALVAAEAPGFRPGGAIAGPGDAPLEIRLARSDGPPAATLKLQPSPVPRAEERTLARELLAPLLAEARAGTLGTTEGAVIPALARVDPERVLDMLEDRAAGATTGALIQVALAQFEDDPAVAAATIEEDLDPAARAQGWLALEGYRPAPGRARREALLDRALADARRVATPGMKIRLLGAVADAWLALGSIERARPILVEGREVADALPRNQWSYEAEDFGEVLAAIDLPAALALFERRGKTNVSPADPATIDRHKAQAALRLARIDPAGAERLMPPPSAQFYQRPEIVLKAARAMAPADLARARRLVETLDDAKGPGSRPSPSLVPFGLGWIAAGLGESDPDPARARAVLDEAFAGLRKRADDDGPGQGPTAVAHLMAELLPVVARLDPDRLAERIWMLEALRPALAAEPKAPEVEQTFVLAMLVGRYDRAVAGAILGPVLERMPDLVVDPEWQLAVAMPTIAKCLTVHDPRSIAGWIRDLPAAARKPPPRRGSPQSASVEAQVRLAAATILGLPDAARLREAGRTGYTPPPYRLGD